jgi:hypothetical protein
MENFSKRDNNSIEVTKIIRDIDEKSNNFLVEVEKIKSDVF